MIVTKTEIDEWIVASLNILIWDKTFGNEERLILEAFRGLILSKVNNIAFVSTKESQLKSIIKGGFESVKHMANSLSSIRETKRTGKVIGSNQVRVIFYPWLNMHVDFLDKIFFRLRADNVESVFYSNNPKIQAKLKPLQPISFESYEWSKETKKYRKAKSNILKKARDISSIQIENYHLTFTQVIKEVFELFPRFLETVTSFYQLLNYFPNTQLIFVGYDITLVGRTISLLAQKHQIKTATVQHGSNQHKSLKFSIADYNFVFGNYYKQALDAILINNVEVLAVGSTKFEHYLNEAYRNKTLPILDDLKSKTPFLVALSGTGHSISENNHVATIAALEQAIAVHKNQHFIFKLHPKDDIIYYEGLKEYDNVTIVSGKHKWYGLDFPEWIKVSRALITGGSAAALEAFILRKHVITIDLLHEIRNANFINEGVSYHCQSSNDLKQAIVSILDKDNRYFEKSQAINLFVRDKFCEDGNPPSEKIADFVEKIILK